MTDYVILLPGNETVWANASPEEQAATFARHDEFTRALEERGHTVTGGAELTPSSSARTLRGSGDSLTVTDGPYAESVEQLTGFYLVSTDDLDGLIEVTKILADGDGAIEIRACIDHSGDSA